MLSAPVNGVEKVGTPPASLAIVAGLAVVALAAELLVWLRARCGSRINREWIRRAERRYDDLVVDYAEHADLTMPLSTDIAIARAVGGAGALLLVSPGSRPAAPTGTAADADTGIVTAPLNYPWWSDGGDYELAVVEVVENEVVRDAVNDVLTRLAAAGIPTRLAVVRTGSSRWLPIDLPGFLTRPSKETSGRHTTTASRHRD